MYNAWFFLHLLVKIDCDARAHQLKAIRLFIKAKEDYLKSLSDPYETFVNLKRLVISCLFKYVFIKHSSLFKIR